MEKMGNGRYYTPKGNNVLMGDSSGGNPYIMKELQKNRNIFTKMGQESLAQ